jgi:amino acid adenylation domain-containing protein
LTAATEPLVEPPPTNLCSGFFDRATNSPDRPALEVAGQTLTYGDLAKRARSLAATLVDHAPATETSLVAILGHRSATAFAGVLGSLAAARGYMPLNPTYPPARNRDMLERSRCRAVIVDSAAVSSVDALLEGVEHELLLLVPEEDVRGIQHRWPTHRVLGSQDLSDGAGLEPSEMAPNDPAYLLFTSGSTGTPKGVLVTQANLGAFVDAASSRYSFSEDDRFSQTFNLTFDLSAFDMFAGWDAGACVCCPTEKSLLNPAEFIRRSRLSVWFSVPSVALFMRRLGVLKPASFETLRWSLFCGEALSADVARDWAEAAPNSTVENLYGPTEATIACTAYRWVPATSPSESELGIVPIGRPFGETSTLVVDNELGEVRPGAVGELLLSGPQVVDGYWEDEETTSTAFVSVDGATYYRTGDRVRRPRGDGPLLFKGRLDNQVKVLGHRVELGEIEAVLRQETGIDSVAALGWPRSPAGASGIVAFVADLDVDASALKHRLGTRLPSYMVPREIRLLPELPLNANGKCDRGALSRLLEES